MVEAAMQVVLALVEAEPWVVLEILAPAAASWGARPVVAAMEDPEIG
jgi:hypothetical protein